MCNCCFQAAVIQGDSKASAVRPLEQSASSSSGSKEKTAPKPKKVIPNLFISVSKRKELAREWKAMELAEIESKEAFRTNGVGPENLAHECNNLKIPLIHISTDFVFKGDSKIKYLPKDHTNPISVYGKSKLKGEENIIRICKKYIIIRTSWVFSRYGNNFLKTILNLAKTKNKIEIIDDQIGCPTSARDIALAIVTSINSFYDAKNQNKIFHFSGDQECSWYEFAKLIVRAGSENGLIKNLPKLEPIKTYQFKSNIASRPKYSALNSEEFYKSFNVSPCKLKESISKTIKELSI